MEQFFSNAGAFLAGGKAHSIYWFLALFGTVFFAITCLLTICGLGGLSDADLDSADVTMDHLDTGYLDFNLFSIRSILAFITVFGWGEFCGDITGSGDLPEPLPPACLPWC
jgi:hypothetical protein